MANIDPYISEIQNAQYGEEVRSSIINALKKVNDDNESYIQLKKDVIVAKDIVVEKVDAFDQKVRDAQTATQNLVTATNTANTAKAAIEGATGAANTAKTNLVNATSTANTAKGNLDASTTAANTAKTNADSARTLLDNAISTGNTTKGNLESAIAEAIAKNNLLDTTNGTAATAKANLEAAISNANTAKSQLQSVIDSADTAKSALSGVITQANAAKQALDGSISTAKNVMQSLHSENEMAASQIEELKSENFNSQEILSGVADLRAYLGLSDDDIFGVQVDYKNKTFTRLAGAVNKTAGADFDSTFFGGIRNCIVADDGHIVAWEGDIDYIEDGSKGQVMTYYPKFYYLVCPVVYDPIIETGIGYHLRKANYYVSEKPRAGFRLHPAFYDADGNEVDFIMRSVYEGSIYDVSASAYLMNDEQVGDFTAGTGDKFCSVSGVKPASGLTQNLTRQNIEQICRNRGEGWHSETIKTISAIQLLMLIEYASLNTQTVIGQGIVSIADNGDYNCSSITGSTASLGSGSGMAEQTVNEKGGVTTTETVNGKVSVRYRGCENIWGNIWKFIYGINIYGNGAMGGGQPYICKDFNFAESKNTDNYEAAGFTVANADGYISAMGYSTKFDWLFIPSESLGNSALPVGDYLYITQNLNGYRIAPLGGRWNGGASAGGFDWDLNSGVGYRYRTIGGRLVYIPSRDSATYATALAAWKQHMLVAA